MTPFSQEAWACRCEWGPNAVLALAPADVTVIVDVFSFTTCVDVATSRGVAILPYSWNDASAAEFARDQRAELAGKRRQTNRDSLALFSSRRTPGAALRAPVAKRSADHARGGANGCGRARGVAQKCARRGGGGSADGKHLQRHPSRRALA